MGDQLPCKQGVSGSIPLVSTNYFKSTLKTTQRKKRIKSNRAIEDLIYLKDTSKMRNFTHQKVSQVVLSNNLAELKKDKTNQ